MLAAVTGMFLLLLQDSCARVLLFRGANKDIKNYNNQTAFQVKNYNNQTTFQVKKYINNNNDNKTLFYIALLIQGLQLKVLYNKENQAINRKTKSRGNNTNDKKR